MLIELIIKILYYFNRYNQLLKNRDILSREYESTDETIRIYAGYIKKVVIVERPTEFFYGLALVAYNV